MEGERKLHFRFSKIKNNRLLNRVQMVKYSLTKVVDVLHNEKKVTKEQIREYIRTHWKKPHVSLFGVKKCYGGGRTKAFCLIYDNEDSLKRFEPQTRLLRVFIYKFYFLIDI